MESDMTTPQRDRPTGETSGSEQRPARELTGAAMAFELTTELATLKQEPSWERGDRNARTLVEVRGFRLVLTALKAGARLREHHTPGWVSIYATTGHLLVRTAGRDVNLHVNDVLVLAADEPHELEALEESSFLLTVAGLDRRT
jgi:quercetin dioxygenase-like cupin family protein